MRDKIADKINRLLSLASSDNPHEAALAAAKAQELMLKHAVTEEELRKAGGDIEVEPIEDQGVDYRSGRQTSMGYKVPSRIPAWHLRLATAMERAFMVKIYYRPGVAVHVVGRKSAREAFILTWKHLIHEITRMSEAGYEVEASRGYGMPVNKKTWNNSFCFGAADTVKDRLSDMQKQLEKGETQETKTSAIVLVDRNKEVTQWVENKLKLRKGSSRPQVNSSSGYQNGRIAGRGLNLDSRRPTKQLGG